MSIHRLYGVVRDVLLTCVGVLNKQGVFWRRSAAWRRTSACSMTRAHTSRRTRAVRAAVRLFTSVWARSDTSAASAAPSVTLAIERQQNKKEKRKRKKENTERSEKGENSNSNNTSGVTQRCKKKSAGKKNTHVWTHIVFEFLMMMGALEKENRHNNHISVKSRFVSACGALQMSRSIAARTSVMSTTR